jgi:hypothetical protein
VVKISTTFAQVAACTRAARPMMNSLSDVKPASNELA